jgi:acyl-CoA dehydrogenase
MDFNLPADTVMLRDMLRRFVQKEARPLEMEFFNTGELPPEIQARLRRLIEQMGLWGLTVPEQYGGGGLDTVATCVIEEELGKTFIPIEIGDLPIVLYACSAEQQKNYLEPALAGERQAILAVREPGIGDPQTWMTTAAFDQGDYRLEGRKYLERQPNPGDFFIVYAKAPSDLNSTHFTAFLLEEGLPGLEITRNEEVILNLTGCRAGAEAMIGEPGRALACGVQAAPRAWIRLGARCVGMVERLLEMSIEHAKDWMSFGATMSARPAVQRMIAEMQVNLESTRWLVYHAAWSLDEDPGAASTGLAAQVRLASGEMLRRAVDQTTMIFAGPGPTPQIEPDRLVRSAIRLDSLELTLENARTIIASDLLNLES